MILLLELMLLKLSSLIGLDCHCDGLNLTNAMMMMMMMMTMMMMMDRQASLPDLFKGSCSVLSSVFDVFCRYRLCQGCQGTLWIIFEYEIELSWDTSSKF